VNRARQLIRAVKILVRDGRIPKPLRGIASERVDARTHDTGTPSHSATSFALSSLSLTRPPL